MSAPLPQVQLKTKKYGTFTLTAFDARDESLRFELMDPNEVVLRNSVYETRLEGATVYLRLDECGRWAFDCSIWVYFALNCTRYVDWIGNAVSNAMRSWVRSKRDEYAVLSIAMAAAVLERVAGDLASARDEVHAAKTRLDELASCESRCDTLLAEVAKANPRAVPLALLHAPPTAKLILLTSVVPNLVAGQAGHESMRQ